VPTWLKIVLGLAVTVVVGYGVVVVMVEYVLKPVAKGGKRAYSITTRAGQISIRALATGGVSLLWPQLEPAHGAKSDREPSRVRVVLAAFATGGVSVLTPRTRRKDERPRWKDDEPTSGGALAT